MKLLTLLALIVSSPFALATSGREEAEACLQQARETIDFMIELEAWSLPNSSNPGRSVEVTQSTSANGEVTYAGASQIFTKADYGYSYTYRTSVTVLTDEECTLLAKPNVKREIVNVEGPEDEAEGTISCARSGAFSCEEGMIDRCQFPEAETHLCVPAP